MSADFDYLHRYIFRQIPAASRCIRVLHVHDSKDLGESEHEPIECRLVVANFDEKPELTALSYVWGLAL
jgi:hypothetical protein